jgi:uncharacterized alkaline shock family protein YloU
VSDPGDSQADRPASAPEPDAEAVAAAAAACEGVHALTRGSDVVEIATYLPGRRVLGVRVSPGRAEVHIVARYGVNVVEVADRVRAAVLAAVKGDTGPSPQVDVYVEDVQAPEFPKQQLAQEQEARPPGIPDEVS